NPITWRIAETENGDRIFNEQLCTVEKGEILTAEKLRKSLEEFEKSDFLIQYKQKKTESISEPTEKSEPEKTSNNKPEYPFVSVQAGWNYEKYISPELETKDYTVPEFNEALKKLNERWDNEEYETKSAFVTLTIHISETESFEKRLNAEYQFKTLSERLEFENDTFDKEVKLRQVVRDAENQTAVPELTDKENNNMMNEPDDDFSDIDTKPVFKSLEETSTDSPFIQQVISDVEHLTKMFETSEQNETVSDSPEEKQMSLFDESENADKKNKEETHVSEPTADNVENKPDNTDFNENAVKYAFGKIEEEHKYDFSNPTFMYLGHLQNYMIDNKIDDIVAGISSETLQKHYGTAPLTEEYFSADYTLSKNLPEEYNAYFQEYTSIKTNTEKEISEEPTITDSVADELKTALENHDIIHLKEVTEDNSGNYPVENARKRKFDNLRIEYDDENGGFLFKGDTATDKNLVLFSYGEISPENLYLSIKNDNYIISGIEKNKSELKKENIPDTENVTDEKIYRVVTYSNDSGADDKEDYSTLNEAIDAGHKYLEDNYYNGYAILNTAEHKIESYGGEFPRDKIFSEDVYENSTMNVPVPNNPTAEKLYSRFAKMFPDIVSGEHTHERYGNVGDALEPLSVEHLGGNTYSFMTYFFQNGDLMRDPDFEFELDHKNKTLNITQYQQDGSAFGTIYQRVYDENNTPDLKLLSALEKNFMQNLRNAKNMERPLTAYTDKNGNKVDLKNEPEITEPTEPEKPEINDNTPELRAVLNEFSEKHGLGELNVDPERFNWKLTEKFADGTDFPLGEITSPVYGKPFTPDELKTALEKFENEVTARNQNVSDIYGRKATAKVHGGVSELQEVQKNLPEITYASRPSEKINNNIMAIQEMMRLENAELNGVNPYDSRSNQPYSKQSSEHRLRQYCGWGGLSQVFDERFKQYEYQRQTLKKLLTPEEYSEAKASSLTSHYTPQIIIDAIYKAVQNMDLPRDSKILEPACGTGNFISRLPHSFGNAEVTGVELDSITARIATQIHHDNDNIKIINSGFENSGLENDSFDLAVGNVPFGDYNMNDPDYVQDWRIHDAFFRKALDKVVAGGVVAFVTSTGTMDKSNPKIREYLATKAELIGAVRLPNTAFSDAGTGVSSDIIFLKKRENPLQPHEPKPDWCYTIPDKNGLKINSYFVQNPQMVLGEMKKTTFQDRLTCEPVEGADLANQLNEAVKNLNAKITVAKREKVVNEQRGKIEPWGKNFTFQLKDDKVYYRKGGQMDEVKCTKSEKEMIKELCEIRDITRKLIDLQKTSVPDSELLPIREELGRLYDKYKSEH
ncbi:MAG: methyltransferase domain-containing protein, partial [Ruminococcus sp.]|nr:methyltransferase domain-containing protein [Ruminococcus sp.]